MIKRGYIFILILLPLLGFTQYGNEWINYDQTYYKFPITETGVYRITYDDLNDNGFPVGSVDPRNIQVFGHEKEVTLHVEGELDGVFNTQDYIEFYAEKPDGRMDSLIFQNHADHVNKFYNYFSDTVNYFITWNTSTNNKRYTTSNSSDYASYSPKPYVYTKKRYSPATDYRNGKFIAFGGGNNITDPRYIAGEGYFSGFISKGQTITNTINLTNVYKIAAGPSAYIYSASSTQLLRSESSVLSNHIRISHSTASGTDKIIFNQTYSGIQVDKLNYSILNSDIVSGNMSFKYSLIDDLGSDQDNYSFAELEVNYPHTTDFEGNNYFEFNTHKTESSPAFRLDVTNISGAQIKIIDVSDNQNRITPSILSGTYRFVLPNILGEETNYVLFSDAALKSISSLNLVSSSGKFENYLDNVLGSNYIIITHPDFRVESLKYKSYRESAQGGAYTTTLINIDQLYNQFGGGIELSPLSIRRLLKANTDLGTELPKGVFIIGKGVNIGTHIENNQAGIRKSQSARDRCLVPVLGEPATDNMYTIGLDGDWNKQSIPIGRYSAIMISDVKNYLEKVIEYEAEQVELDFSLTSKLWQKNVLHFVGGTDYLEQGRFLEFTRYGKKFIENPFFGANVEEYLKDGTLAIDPSALSTLQEKIENGISIIQYFGHSNYSDGFDTNLDKPSNWNNKGKYPIVVANGCNSGDLYRNTDIKSNSEDYVILQDEGAIAYVSTTATGFDYPLARLSEKIYKNLSVDFYAEPLGVACSNALSTVLDYYKTLTTDSELYNGSFIPTTIHGDPMIKANVYNKPEYVIPTDGISFSPASPTLEDKELTVLIDVYNLGKSVDDTLTLELKRIFPNGKDSIYYKSVYNLNSHQQITFNIPVNHSISGGLNEFTASIDIPSYVEELIDEEFNNKTSRNLVVFSDGIIPLLPFEFAIEQQSKRNLVASTLNPDAELNTYLIEIDTVDTFDSNWKKGQEIQSVGGSITIENAKWEDFSDNLVSEIQFTDSTVYFWRTSLKDEVDWKESSFQYIKNRNGWEQAHFHQFKNDEFQNLIYNRPNRTIDYDNSKVKISAEMFSNPTSAEEFGQVNYKIFSKIQDTWGGYQLSPALLFAVIDPNTLRPWEAPKTLADGTVLNPTRKYGQFNEESNPVRGAPDKYFVYQQHEAAQLQNVQTLIDAVPDGHFILMYTFKTTDYSNWDALHPGLYAELQALGASQIISGQADNMIAFLAKKGDPSITQEFYSNPVGIDKELHVFEAEFTANSIGVIDAPVAGPSGKWNSIYWQQNPLETSSADSSRLYIYGVDGFSNETLLIDTLMSTKDSIIDLYTLIDASSYPFLRLRSNLWDKVTNTPAQINRWQIMYDPVPEASIEPRLGLHYSAENNEVLEGEDVEFAVAFKNISEIDMDSILIKYWIEDRNHKSHLVKLERLDSLRVGQIMIDTIYFNTLSYGGENTIWLEINPISESTNMPDQLEQYHFNNYYQKRLFVIEDKENPVVDVTFDGTHIFDGDIVSPSPNIIMKFKDENPILKMNADSDISLFQISMIYPDEIFEKQIYFKNGNGETIMQWYPASGDNNEFIIEYKPDNLPDGIYTLKVQGTDKSNNLSGDLSYDVEFEVINESSITHFYNYPNPFSTKTRFVFTLTGSKVPDDIYIQIMTITGKVVKQITHEQLGNIRIGKNITDYFWNGTDDFGDVLANGVYLYRVVSKINGEEVKHRETSKDNLFKHKLGKLYILR